MIGIDSLYAAEGMFAYALVFLLAATPWIEILVVIPAAIALGLDPLFVSILAFTGNLATVYLLIFDSNTDKLIAELEHTVTPAE